MNVHRTPMFALVFCLVLLPLTAAAQAVPQPQQGGDLGQMERSQPLGETANAVLLEVYDQNHCRYIRLTQTYDFNQYRCRWQDEDVTKYFMDPDFAGSTLSSSRLTVDYSDADFHSSDVSVPPELDVVQFGAAVNAHRPPTRATLDVLKGWDRTTETFTANVTREMRDNLTYSIPFKLNIDAGHPNQNYWCLYLRQVKLVTTYSNCIQPKDGAQDERTPQPTAKEICQEFTKQQSFSGLKLPAPVCK